MPDQTPIPSNTTFVYVQSILRVIKLIHNPCWIGIIRQYQANHELAKAGKRGELVRLIHHIAMTGSSATYHAHFDPDFSAGKHYDFTKKTPTNGNPGSLLMMHIFNLHDTAAYQAQWNEYYASFYDDDSGPNGALNDVPVGGGDGSANSIAV